MRLDQALAVRFPDVSRRKARELITAHRVLVNDRPVSVASRDVDDGDRIAIVDALPDLAILRMTDNWIAVDKPVGIATQPERERKRRSLEEIVRVQLKQRGLASELYLVHRLDTPTSGVVLFARTREAAAKLSALFADRSIQKTYLAIIEGELNEERLIDTLVQGKHARTVLRPLRSDGATTLVEATIETGRMHQIRIHAASIGHPVVGDRRYGSSISSKRLMLHAWKLEHAMFGVIEAPVPTGFELESE